MKTYTIYDALEFLTLNGFYTNNVISIKYVNVKKNKYTFNIIFEQGFKIFLDLDSETYTKTLTNI